MTPQPATPAAASTGMSPLVVGGGAALVVGVVGAGGLGYWAWSLDETLASTSAKGSDKQFAYDYGIPIVVGAGAGAVVAVAGAAVLAVGLVSE